MLTEAVLEVVEELAPLECRSFCHQFHSIQHVQKRKKIETAQVIAVLQIGLTSSKCGGVTSAVSKALLCFWERKF